MRDELDKIAAGHRLSSAESSRNSPRCWSGSTTRTGPSCRRRSSPIWDLSTLGRPHAVGRPSPAAAGVRRRPWPTASLAVAERIPEIRRYAQYRLNFTFGVLGNRVMDEFMRRLACGMIRSPGEVERFAPGWGEGLHDVHPIPGRFHQRTRKIKINLLHMVPVQHSRLGAQGRPEAPPPRRGHPGRQRSRTMANRSGRRTSTIAGALKSWPSKIDPATRVRGGESRTWSYRGSILQAFKLMVADPASGRRRS